MLLNTQHRRGHRQCALTILTPEAAQEDSKAVHSRYTIRGKANVREVGRVEAQIYYGAAKPECSITELREIEGEEEKERKDFSGIPTREK